MIIFGSLLIGMLALSAFTERVSNSPIGYQLRNTPRFALKYLYNLARILENFTIPADVKNIKRGCREKKSILNS